MVYRVLRLLTNLLLNIRYTCLIALLLSLTTPVLAKQQILPQLKFQHIAQGELEALGHINDIAQDAEGYMWFAAAKGLARYNGHELTMFRHQSNLPGLPSSWVHQLLLTQKQQLWVLTRKGLCRYQAHLEQFTCTGLEEENKTSPTYSAIFEDRHQQLWLAGSFGLLLVNQETLNLTAHTNPWLQTHSTGDTHAITTIIEDDLGGWWLGHQDAGLSYLPPKAVTATRTPNHLTNQSHPHLLQEGLHWQKGDAGLISNKVRALLLDTQQRLWIGTQGQGIILWDTHLQHAKKFEHSKSEKSDSVWDIHQDKRGLIWVGDGTGVHLISPDDLAVESYSLQQGKPLSPSNFVARSLFEDKSGGIWAGYFPTGTDRVDEQASQFVSYIHTTNNIADTEYAKSLTEGGVLSTLEAPDGKIWVGAGFGLGLLDTHTDTFEHFNHEPNNPNSLAGSTILDLTYGQPEQLWIGIWDRGLNRWDLKTNQFSHYLPEPNNPHSLLGREPWGLLYDSKQRLWIATEKGINRYRPSTDDFVHYLPVDDGVPTKSLYTRHIYEDKQGRLWVASFGGLYQLDPQTGAFTRFRHDTNNPNSISSDLITSLFEDSQGRFWVGTDGAGLNLFDRQRNRFLRFGEEIGLPDLSISSIVEDTQQQLWLATYQGLVKFDPSRGVISHYTRQDGLPGHLFNRDSGLLLSTGALIFGSTEGLVRFKPEQLLPTRQNPSLIFNQLFLFNQPVSINDATGLLQRHINHTKHITFKHTQSMFTIEFTALMYQPSVNNQYSYRLKGFDDNWRTVSNQRSATYTNLDAGQYTFEVKGFNTTNGWETHVKRLNITVIPPLWLTWWAKAVYVLCIGGFLFRYLLIQSQRLKRTHNKLNQERELVIKMREVERMKDNLNRELDAKVAVRTRELQKEKERLTQAHEQLAALNQQLNTLSVTDQLTSLHNRRYLDQVINEDIALVERQFLKLHDAQVHTPEAPAGLVFVILDMDDFKSVNDTHGHDAGDDVLKELAVRLQATVRQSDYIVRWGGEEFVIVMRDLKQSAVEASIERIRSCVANHPFAIGDAQSTQALHKTVSIGFACYPFHPQHTKALSWQQVIGLADHALFCAKRSGKNQWVGLAPNLTMTLSDSAIKQWGDEAKLQHALSHQHLLVRAHKPAQQLRW